MQVNPYLTFDGDCEQAFKAYAKVLGGEIVAMIPHEGTPAAEHVPAERRRLVVTGLAADRSGGLSAFHSRSVARTAPRRPGEEPMEAPLNTAPPQPPDQRTTPASVSRSLVRRVGTGGQGPSARPR